METGLTQLERGERKKEMRREEGEEEEILATVEDEVETGWAQLEGEQGRNKRGGGGGGGGDRKNRGG